MCKVSQLHIYYQFGLKEITGTNICLIVISQYFSGVRCGNLLDLSLKTIKHLNYIIHVNPRNMDTLLIRTVFMVPLVSISTEFNCISFHHGMTWVPQFILDVVIFLFIKQALNKIKQNQSNNYCLQPFVQLFYYYSFFS